MRLIKTGSNYNLKINRNSNEVIQMQTSNSRNRKTVFFTTFQSFIITSLLISMLVACAGDTRMSSGAKTGALVGAGVGLLMGALTGDADVAVAATAVGAGAGASRGAYEGWRQDQDDQRTRQITEAIRETKQSGGQQLSDNAETRAREELTRFLGVWAMEGWIQESGEKRRNVQAQVNGDIEMNHFVQLAYIDLKVTGVDSQVWGTSTLGYDKDDGYNISTRLNTLPEPLRTSGGSFDQSSRSFIFKGSDYRLNIRFNNPDRFTVETFAVNGGSEQQVEFYTFTRT